MRTINNINNFLYAELYLCATDIHTACELHDEIKNILERIIEIPELFLVRLELLKLACINHTKINYIYGETYRFKILQTIAYGIEVIESAPN